MAVELTYSPSALPGSCKSCGGSGPEKMPMVDTKTTEDFHGAVYYCRECLFDMATLFGFTLPEQADETKVQLTYFQVENTRLQKVVASLEGAIDGLVSSGMYTLVDVPDPILHEAITDAETGPSDSDKESRVREGAVIEPSDDSLLAGVHSNQQQLSNDDEFRFNF